MTTRSFSTIKPRTNQAGKRIHHREPGVVKFCAIDGEGINRDGSHIYALLGCGDDQISDENGLDWKTIFEFLYSHYQKGTAYVGFFLGYDFNQWFKTLPMERAAMLLTPEGQEIRRRKRGKNPAPFPVRHDGWEFDILGMKRLKIRPMSCDHPFIPGKPACKCPKKPWMAICDVGPFFQQSFLSVINPAKWPEPIVTEAEYEEISQGKANRSNVQHIDAQVCRYNRLENEILCRVLATLDRGLRDIGVNLPPTKWFGPGQSAQAWLISEGVKRAKEYIQHIPQWFLDAAQASYIGGWFELFMHGLIKGWSHEYDINNAYPYIIASLPCLEHGEYTRGNGTPSVRNNEMCLVRARVWSRSPLSPNPLHKRTYIGAMLHRDGRGRIYRPTVTEGWFWWHELQAAIRAKCVQPFRNSGDRLHPKCFEWVKYSPCDCLPPMRRIGNLYLRRLAVGKDSPLGKAAKTTYNSAYGKFAQSVGHPLFGNPIYASLITAGCRTMILDAIATHPKGAKDVAMVATDAIYFVHEHPGLPVSERLGEWSHKARHNLTLFKPGVYWDDGSRRAVENGEAPALKSRGLSARDFAGQIGRIDQQFREWGGVVPPDESWPLVRFQAAFSMVTCLQAIQRDSWELAGHVSDSEPRMQSSAPWDKRGDPYFDAEYGVMRTVPRTPELVHNKVNGDWQADWDCTSVPYEKRFGMDDPFSDEYRADMGVTPDGYAYDVIGMAWKELADA
jgi:hypothetical protein